MPVLHSFARPPRRLLVALFAPTLLAALLGVVSVATAPSADAALVNRGGAFGAGAASGWVDTSQLDVQNDQLPSLRWAGVRLRGIDPGTYMRGGSPGIWTEVRMSWGRALDTGFVTKLRLGATAIRVEGQLVVPKRLPSQPIMRASSTAALGYVEDDDRLTPKMDTSRRPFVLVTVHGIGRERPQLATHQLPLGHCAGSEHRGQVLVLQGVRAAEFRGPEHVEAAVHVSRLAGSARPDP